MRNILLAPLVASLLLSCASADVRERKVSSAQTAAPPITDIFSEFTPPRPVPEIMSLKPGEVVPIGTYAKYGSKHIGLTIVYKKFVEEERASGAEVANPFYDYFNDGEIQLAFSEKNIESIAAKGFLNTHQVGKSMELYRRGRVKLEDGFLGYVLEASFPPTASNEVRPKYAYFSMRTIHPDHHPLNGEGAAEKGFQLGYGNVVAVLNDDVKNRATFTMGDSTGAGNKSLVHTLRFESEEPLPLLGYGGFNYLEAQVWGAVTMADVHHFVVNCADTWDSIRNEPWGAISAPGLKKLRALQKPIYECEKEKASNGRVVRVRAGKRI